MNCQPTQRMVSFLAISALALGLAAWQRRRRFPSAKARCCRRQDEQAAADAQRKAEQVAEDAQRKDRTSRRTPQQLEMALPRPRLP